MNVQAALQMLTWAQDNNDLVILELRKQFEDLRSLSSDEQKRSSALRAKDDEFFEAWLAANHFQKYLSVFFNFRFTNAADFSHLRQILRTLLHHL